MRVEGSILCGSFGNMGKAINIPKQIKFSSKSYHLFLFSSHLMFEYWILLKLYQKYTINIIKY